MSLSTSRRFAQRKLKRTSIALHVAKLRNFFRYAGVEAFGAEGPVSRHSMRLAFID